VPLNETQLSTIADALQGAKYDTAYLKVKSGKLSFITMSGQALPVTVDVDAPAAKGPAPSAKKAKEAKAADVEPPKAAAPSAPPSTETAASWATDSKPAGPSAGAAASGWLVEYAKDGDHTCELTAAAIEQGTLRIGREIEKLDKPHSVGKKVMAWYTVEALFASFRKGAADKARISDVAELEGFEALGTADQSMLTELVSSEAAAREALDGAQSHATRLEHTKDGGVFWQISQSGRITRTQWGAIGVAGALTDKEHADEAAAAKYVEKMVAQKLKGGYKERTVVLQLGPQLKSKW
jgi:predicted DNA-binding WGR domain protein